MAFEDNGLSERVKERMSHGRTKMVGAPIIFKLADALQCDARWLATGHK